MTKSLWFEPKGLPDLFTKLPQACQIGFTDKTTCILMGMMSSVSTTEGRQGSSVSKRYVEARILLRPACHVQDEKLEIPSSIPWWNCRCSVWHPDTHPGDNSAGPVAEHQLAGKGCKFNPYCLQIELGKEPLWNTELLLPLGTVLSQSSGLYTLSSILHLQDIFFRSTCISVVLHFVSGNPDYN